jgi:hypothetical protein
VVSFAGLTASWPQAEIAAHITTSPEAFFVAERENEGQSGDVPDTVDLQQSLGLRILRLCQLLDQAIIVLDLGRHLRDVLKHRTERRLKTRRHDREAPFSEATRGGRRHTMATGLGQAANRVHGSCAQPNQKISRTDQSEGLLLFDGAVGDRPEDVRIQTSVASQLLSIDLIALAIYQEISATQLCASQPTGENPL